MISFSKTLLILAQIFLTLALGTTPVVADFTLGFNGVGVNTDGGSSSNALSGARFTTGPGSGIVTSMSVYMGSGVAASPNNQFQLAIYTDSNGNPATLMASSPTGTLTSNSWNTVSLNVSVAANTSYWLMYNTNGSTNHLKYDLGVANQSGYKTQTFGSWPTSTGTLSLENLKFSIYGTVATDVGPTPTPTVGPTATPTQIPTPTPTPGSSASVIGQFGPVLNWPLVAVHANLLPTGKVLMWDAWETYTSNTRVWDPATNTFELFPVSGGLFCAAQTNIENGDVVVMGGHNGDGEAGIKDVSEFNPFTNTWTKKAPMSTARWYPSVTTLADNRVLALSGQRVTDAWANTPDIYNPSSNTTTSIPVSTTQLREQQYPHTYQLPSGKVLSISGEFGGVQLLDVGASTWTNIGNTPVPWGMMVSYAPNKFIAAGGGNSFANNSAKIAYTLDMSSGSAVWTSTAQMNIPRSFFNIIMLPTGKVMVFGGSQIVDDTSTNGTLTNEMWDPDTNNWTLMANSAVPRMYHSTAVLLPDGRVMVAGGGRLSPAVDHLNAEIYSPPYLFQGPRPTISSAPQTIDYATTFALQSPEAANISKITISNLAALTHDVDGNQHFMELPFTLSGNTLTVSTPTNSNYLPAGYYMVFLVNSQGVPSEAKIIKINGVTPSPTPTLTPTVTPTAGPTPTPTNIPTPTVVPTSTPTPTPTPTPAPGSTLSIWSSTSAPGNFDNSDTSSVELGVKFRSTTGGYIKGVKFYKSSQSTGTYTGSLWSRTGTQLASKVFTGVGTSGWQTVLFPNSVAITANTTYVASYHLSNGRYAQDASFFQNSGVTNLNLTALKNGTDGSNGVYRYSSSIVFPNQTYSSSNYWVDVIYSQTP